MAKLGRNEPCWCGSGKKYKSCHLNEDERAESRKLVTLGLEERIEEYAMHPAYEADFKRAFELYFGHEMQAPEEDAEIVESQRAFDYFIFDYALPDGKHVIERFAAAHERNLSADERALVADWQHSRYTAFEVIAVDHGVGMRLRDLVTGEEFDTLEKRLTQDLSRWQILIARLVRVRDHYELGGASAMHLPAAYRDWLGGHLNNEWDRYQVDHPESDYEEFLRANNPQLNQFIENEILPELETPPAVVTAEGDLSELCTATFDVADYPAARAGMRSAEEFDEESKEEAEPGVMPFSWKEAGASLELLRAHGPEFEHTPAIGESSGGVRSLGTLALSREALTLQVISRRRLEAGKELLTMRLGRAIRHRADETRGLDEMLADLSARPADSLPEEESPEELAAMEAEIAALYHRDWLDQQIPALEDQTPRQAVKTFGGRVRVIRLLKEFEASQDRAAPAGAPSFDVNELKAELGITEQDLLAESRLEDQMKRALDEILELADADRVDEALAGWRAFRAAYPLTSAEDLEFAQVWDLADIVDEVMNELGHHLASLKRYDEAMTLLEEYLALGPLAPEEVRADLAEIRVERGDVEQGVRELEQLVAAAPQSFLVTLALANVHREVLNQPERAVETLRQALHQVDEDDQGLVYGEILKTYLEFRSLDQAEQFWHAENDPDTEEEKDYVGWTRIALARGDLSAARERAEHVREEGTRAYWLGMVEARAGHFDKASELWSAYLEKPKGDFWFLWAQWVELQLRLHHFDLVVEKVDPRKLNATPIGYWYLALAYAGKGDLSRAAEWARAARGEMERRWRKSSYASTLRDVRELADTLQLFERARQALEIS